jgi:adenosylmethionine-8-amino-7-oxononanoate aminotransferase
LKSLPKSPIWRPYTQEQTALTSQKIVKAEGAYLYTQEGQRIFDGISSWWLTTHGHCHPRIVEAIQQQAAKIDQVTFANFTHEPAEELAELLIRITPPELKRVFFSDNGSTAVEVALKMALQSCGQRGFSKKTKFLAFDSSYHGDTVGAMSVSGTGPFNEPYKKTLFQVLRAKQPSTSDATAQDYTEDFERLIKIHYHELAAVIIEPLIQGAAGMIVWPIQAVQRIAELCRKFDVYLIFDEVMTGFGRTGEMFAMNRAGVVPDIVCLSKGLTGGALPLAVTIVRDEIYQSFLGDSRDRMLFHGHSFTGNPISCAAAVASIKIFNEEKTLGRLKLIEAHHRKAVSRIKKNIQCADVRICGTMAAIELVEDRRGYLSEKMSMLAASAIKEGVFLRTLGNVVYLLPSYCVTESDLIFAWDVIESELRKILI